MFNMYQVQSLSKPKKIKLRRVFPNYYILFIVNTVTFTDDHNCPMILFLIVVIYSAIEGFDVLLYHEESI